MNVNVIDIVLPGMSVVRVSVAVVSVSTIFPVTTFCLSVGPQTSIDPSLPAVGPLRRTTPPTPVGHKKELDSNIQTCSGIFSQLFISSTYQENMSTWLDKPRKQLATATNANVSETKERWHSSGYLDRKQVRNLIVQQTWCFFFFSSTWSEECLRVQCGYS